MVRTFNCALPSDTPPVTLSGACAADRTQTSKRDASASVRLPTLPPLSPRSSEPRRATVTAPPTPGTGLDADEVPSVNVPAAFTDPGSQHLQVSHPCAFTIV